MRSLSSNLVRRLADRKIFFMRLENNQNKITTIDPAIICGKRATIEVKRPLIDCQTTSVICVALSSTTPDGFEF